MYQDLLSQTGLTPNQATIYELLLQEGASKASKISQKSPLKRGLVYKILDELVELKLAKIEEKSGSVALFTAEHPNALRELVKQKEAEVERAKAGIDQLLPQLTSEFNLAIGKPGVKFYEGLEGIKQVLKDTITNNQQKSLLTFSDVGGYAKYLSDWNTKYYAPERQANKIFEKVIIPNSPGALDYMKDYQGSDVTEILFIDNDLYPFSTEINIYENKVSFVTFSPKVHIGAIVESKEIADTMTAIFNFTWQIGKKYCADLQPEWLSRYQSSIKKAVN